MDKIIQVDELTDVTTVNHRLKDGWVLLNTVGGCYEDGMTYFRYSIGLPEPPKTTKAI